MKTLAKTLIRKNPLPVTFQEKLLFFGKCRYWPDFENPRSFNEKINWRKLNSTNNLFVTCCDKLEVRDYAREKIGGEFLIPVVFEGESITPEQLHALGNDIVVKTNHDSGSVYIIRENTPEEAAQVSAKIEKSLKSNYGKETREWYYTRVKPKVYVEKLLSDEKGKIPFDLKFFVFRGKDGSPPRTVIEVDHDRGTPNHHRTFYDENGEILFFNETGVRIDTEPNHRVPFPCPKHLDEMHRVALKLAEDFDHIRVDLYHVKNRIYFGELTLSDGGGRSRWTPREFDFYLGELWDLNRDPGGSECPEAEEVIVEQKYIRPDPLRRLKFNVTQRLKRVADRLGVFGSRVMRFFALPYAVVKLVDWTECRRNPVLVCFDHLYIFFALKSFPDNYACCRLHEKPRSEWKYYYGWGYDPLAISKRNRHVRRPECTVLFEDKEASHALFRSFMLPQPRQYGAVDPDDDLNGILSAIFDQQDGKRVFIKPVNGDGGKGACLAQRESNGIFIRQTTDPKMLVPVENFRLTLRSVLQEGVIQHPHLDELYAESLNTVRAVTLLTPEKDILLVGAVLRIGRGCNFVDNGEQGGLGSLIDLKTGQLSDVAIDDVGRRTENHPDTGVAFAEVTVPFWDETLELAREVQRQFSSFNRFIGMDIGISEDGPVLIEVNDIFGSGIFEAVAGPLLADDEVRRCLLEYGMVTHNKFN
ncbi:MAG: ATP-grasp fold amidoligase family protein [Verrucomicrobiales bacterium]|nr:ATP-grasp fold amidoligase family protein [Verrucomicrobiales bacterium]